MNTNTTKSQHGNVIATLDIQSLKELIVLRRTIQERMDSFSDNTCDRHEIIEYLTLGQLLVRLPEPLLLTPQVCTAKDIER